MGRRLAFQDKGLVPKRQKPGTETGAKQGQPSFLETNVRSEVLAWWLGMSPHACPELRQDPLFSYHHSVP